MRRFLLSIILSALSLSLFAQAKPNKISAKQAKEDLDYLYTTLQQTHYDLYVNTEKVVFDKRLEELKAGLTDSVDMLDFHRRVQPFVALSELAHCSSEFPFQTNYGPYIQKGGSLFPFSMDMEGKRVLINENYSEREEIEQGDELVSINGKPIASVMADMYAHLSGESQYLKNSLINQLEFARVYWLVYDEVKRFELQLIRKADKKQYSIQLEAKAAAEVEEHFEKKEYLFDLSREFKFIEDIAYLKPGLFLNQSADGNTSEHNTFDKSEFVQFIDSSFAQILSSNSEHLIIDLRGNPGGDNSFSDYMLSYFAHEAFWFCSEFHVRTSEITKKFWEGVEQENLKGMRSQILENKNGAQFQIPFGTYEPLPVQQRYHGQVYVLINRYSYSNTVSTAAIIKDYGFGTILGEITADTPTSFGAVHQFPLPHSRINITFPKALIIRPNGSRNLIGVRPDFPIKEVRNNGVDDVLEGTLEFIRNRQQ
ncbi:MAG: S41 family peptidase [Bacteroidia bacterium]|nr:S41 family peptidase [Bacteroidia bacterium]